MLVVSYVHSPHFKYITMYFCDSNINCTWKMVLLPFEEKKIPSRILLVVVTHEKKYTVNVPWYIS